MKFLQRIAIVLLICSALLPADGRAAGSGGCESFEWPLKTELEWMSSSDTEAVASGGKIEVPPQKAIALALQPMDAVALLVPATGKPKGDVTKAFGGVVNFDRVDKAGVYQVSLSSAGWIDVVQGGKALPAAAHTGKSDCEGLRKSVRFALEAGPFAIQLNGVPNDSIKIAVRPAE